MTERRRRTEGSPDRGEAAAEPAEAAMGRFKSLARRLLHVPRDELTEQQKKSAEAKMWKRRQSE